MAAASAAAKGVVRCTRRIRDPLSYLIMQPTDADQVCTSIRTTDVAILTFYLPIHNLQHCLHRRYEAEQFGELILPPGVAAPMPKSLTQTEAEAGKHAAATKSAAMLKKMIMSAPQREGATEAAANSADVNQLNNHVNEKGETVVPLGLVTLLVGHNHPSHQSWLEKKLDPAPHPSLSLRISVMDRIHWQRTTWLAGAICPSLCWGRIPQRIFSINLDYKSPILITAGGEGGPSPPSFDEAAQMYRRPLRVELPSFGFSAEVSDSGTTIFNPRVKTVDGFLDNESALHRLALAREINMLGLGGSVYRQTLWSSPTLPNVGGITHLRYGSLFQHYFGCDPVGEPVAAWMVREVDKTLIYQMEGEVEDENDPNSATTYGDRSLTERVQKKAMNRYNGFRDELRGKTYSDMRGDEVPR